jgi:acetoin utilization deacetylase AcuC-like enzyme
MKAFYTDIYPLPLPEGHRFPIAKYRMLRSYIEESGLVSRSCLVAPPAATDEELLRVHTADYLQRTVAGEWSVAEARRVGLPWSPEMVERSRRSVGATVQACRAALADGVAINLAGGTHHAFSDAGEGYCVFNDAAVAIEALRAEGLIRRAVVLDLDVHQGNGTAHIFRNDPEVFTLSVHGEKNFPLRKEASSLDLPLPDGVGDEAFLSAVALGAREAILRSRADLAIYLAGADPHEDDRLGRMKVTAEGLRRRDEMVFRLLRAAGLPVAVAMAGGYGRDVAVTARLHFQTVEVAVALFKA